MRPALPVMLPLRRMCVVSWPVWRDRFIMWVMGVASLGHGEHPCFLARFLWVSGMMFPVFVHKRFGVPFSRCLCPVIGETCSLWSREHELVAAP